MKIDPTLGVLLGAFLGAFAGIAGAAINTFVTQMHESKRHLREQVIRTAFDQWSRDRDVARQLGAKHEPLSAYVVQMAKVVAMLEERDLTPERAVAAMKDFHAVLEAVERANLDYTEKKKQWEQDRRSLPS